MEQPETYKIIKPFIKHLKSKDSKWQMLNIHGNAFTSTLPDKLLINPRFTQKLVEFKVIHDDGTVSLTRNQKSDWPTYIPGGLKFWVIAAYDLRGPEKYHLREHLYNKLFEEPNCEYLLSRKLHRYLYR